MCRKKQFVQIRIDTKDTVFRGISSSVSSRNALFNKDTLQILKLMTRFAESLLCNFAAICCFTDGVFFISQFRCVRCATNKYVRSIHCLVKFWHDIFLLSYINWRWDHSLGDSLGRFITINLKNRESIVLQVLHIFLCRLYSDYIFLKFTHCPYVY